MSFIVCKHRHGKRRLSGAFIANVSSSPSPDWRKENATFNFSRDRDLGGCVGSRYIFCCLDFLMH